MMMEASNKGRRMTTGPATEAATVAATELTTEPTDPDPVGADAPENDGKDFEEVPEEEQPLETDEVLEGGEK